MVTPVQPPKRRLPLLPSQPPTPSGAGGDGDEADERPPWQWIGFGTAAIFGAWLPLAYLAEGVKARVLRGYVSDGASAEDAQLAIAALTSGERTRLLVMTAILYVGPLLAGAYAGGFLVGKWGGKAGVREAALAGAATAMIVSALSWSSTGLSWAPLVGLALATPASALGGLAGTRRRAP